MFDNMLLSLDNVHKMYPDKHGNMMTILNGIDLVVGHREFITVVGPSGCGKSTLLRLILGAEKPTRGTIHMDGRPLSWSNRDRGIVFQRYSLFPHFTILENVAKGLVWESTSLGERVYSGFGYFPFFSYRKKRKQCFEKAAYYLERVGLAGHLDKYPNQLSGGQRQRAAIAQAVVMKPKILMMDEPFGALDDTTRQDMQLFILEEWQKNPMSIFFVTHDLEEAIFLGTRILVLSQFYDDDIKSEGAKLVGDLKTASPHPKSVDFKYTPYFNLLLKTIRRDGLDPNTRQHIRNFNMTHPHAFREEWRTNGEEATNSRGGS